MIHIKHTGSEIKSTRLANQLHAKWATLSTTRTGIKTKTKKKRSTTLTSQAKRRQEKKERGKRNFKDSKSRTDNSTKLPCRVDSTTASATLQPSTRKKWKVTAQTTRHPSALLLSKRRPWKNQSPNPQRVVIMISNSTLVELRNNKKLLRRTVVSTLTTFSRATKPRIPIKTINSTYLHSIISHRARRRSNKKLQGMTSIPSRLENKISSPLLISRIFQIRHLPNQSSCPTHSPTKLSNSRWRCSNRCRTQTCFRMSWLKQCNSSMLQTWPCISRISSQLDNMCL